MSSIYTKIAYEDDLLFSVWGPCSDGGKLNCDCPQCEHANDLEREGKDWDVEYENAMVNGATISHGSG